MFHKKFRERKYSATFIDQGYCFNAGKWKLVDAPLREVYARNSVYQGITGWKSFEPWLSRIEEFDPQKAWRIAETVPPEWYGGRRRTRTADRTVAGAKTEGKRVDRDVPPVLARPVCELDEGPGTDRGSAVPRTGLDETHRQQTTHVTPPDHRY